MIANSGDWLNKIRVHLYNRIECSLKNQGVLLFTMWDDL